MDICDHQYLACGFERSPLGPCDDRAGFVDID
jgi:hypothetical protein